MIEKQAYTTSGGVNVSRTVTEVEINTALEDILFHLDSKRGGLLKSSYEYPGRYKRWAIGFVNPPLEVTTRDKGFTITALNDRGKVLLPMLLERLSKHPQLSSVKLNNTQDIIGAVKATQQLFTEEERSKRPSAFTVIRDILQVFYSDEDEHLGLYGAFGYDLVLQFEPISQRLQRADDQRDLVLYLPDELVVVDYYLQRAYRLSYEFETAEGSTDNLPRTGESIDYRGKQLTPERRSDHEVGEYAEQVGVALDYFRRGDLFEVVPSQNFSITSETAPSELFTTLQEINPSPYGFIFNLGGEYIIGSSPEIFVRVDGRRVETCPISGTIARGRDALD
ncbi:MAG: chorismate-binding protein, partial [Rivularia sp. (in: cyanobacteria)]